jgi:hypothetical protein
MRSFQIRSLLSLFWVLCFLAPSASFAADLRVSKHTVDSGGISLEARFYRPPHFI